MVTSLSMAGCTFIALLNAANAELISVDASLCIRFIRAVSKIYKDAPAKFWLQLKPEMKENLREIFEKAVWGIEFSDSSIWADEGPTSDVVTPFDFKDSDDFLTLLLMMDDEDISDIAMDNI